MPSERQLSRFAARRFHYTSYDARMIGIAVLMMCSYTTVALSGSRPLQLLGVVFSAMQACTPVFSTSVYAHDKPPLPQPDRCM